MTNSRERHVLFGGMPRYPKACWWRQSATRNPKKARHKGIKDQPQLVLSFTAVGSQLLHSIVSTTMASHHRGKHLFFSLEYVPTLKPTNWANSLEFRECIYVLELFLLLFFTIFYLLSTVITCRLLGKCLDVFQRLKKHMRIKT